MDIIDRLQKCGDCPIRHRAVCSRCDDAELARLEAMKYYRTFEAGTKILWSGDPLEYVASLVDGVASLSRTMEDGRTQIVGLLLASDFIGRPGRDHTPYDVSAVTDVTLCCFRRRPFEKLIEETPHLGGRLLELALDELDAAREWMLLLGRKTARERIASFFLMIEYRTRIPGLMLPAPLIELPLTREEMADFLGLTLETVSRQISALRKDGVISIRGKRGIEILDVGALKAASGNDDF